jgi:hypothetical protein
MNLKKYTKAELISKLQNKQINNQNSLINQIKNYLLQIWDLILTFKNILVRLTFISLVIQFFKKYKMFRKLWFLLNTIVMTIFGISIFENSMFEVINNFFAEIRFIAWNITDYLTNTNFYNYLTKLFYNNPKKEIVESIKEVKKEIIKEAKNEIINDIRKTPSDRGHSWDPKDQKYGDELEEFYNRRKNKISEWLKPQTEVIEQTDINTESSYKKYLILTGVIVASSLAWYYSDEIKTNFTALMEWLMSFRTGPGDGTGNDSNNSSTHIETNFQSKLEKSTVSEKIELIDLSNKGKTIDISNLSESEIERRGFTSPSLDDLNKNVTEDWKIRSMSPSSSSTSSTETITPSSFTSFNIDNEKMSSISGLKQLTELVQELDPQKVSEKMEWIENNLKDIDNNEIKNKIIESFKDIQFINDEFNSKFDIIKSKGLLNDNFKLNQIEFQNKKIQNWIEKYSDEIND